MTLTESSSCSSFLTLDSEASFSTPIRGQPFDQRADCGTRSSVGGFDIYGSVRTVSNSPVTAEATGEKESVIKCDPLPSPVLTKAGTTKKQGEKEVWKTSFRKKSTTDPKAAELKLKKNKKLVKLVSEIVLQTIKKYSKEFGNDLTTEIVKEVSNASNRCVSRVRY